MRAGPLRHRVVLQTYTETQDAFGGMTPTWSTLATVWAAVEWLMGREYLEAKQLEGELAVRIRIRNRTGVTERTRVTWTDPNNTAHVFEVVAVQQDATGMRELVLMCREVE